MILPDIISEEPLGPVVPHGDEQWYDIAKVVMAILIYAEAYGVGMENVPTQPVTGDASDGSTVRPGGFLRAGGLGTKVRQSHRT